jgi:Zn-dependent peptidase ImmA (M78 family)
MTDKIYDDRKTRPIPPEERESLAEAWLKNSGELHGGPVDILNVLNSAGIALVEWSLEKMGDDKARAYPQIRTVVARPDLMRGLKRSCPSDLMAMAHEFGHCVINDGPNAKPLKISGNAKLPWIDDRESEEGLAWQLARAIMMPRAFVTDRDSAEGIATRFQVPLEQATIRLAELRFERRKGLQHPSEIERPILPACAERAWRYAAISEGHDAEWYRLTTGNYLVALVGYGRPKHKLGWFLQKGRIYANEESDPSWWLE